jgi:hypothetical protein
MSPGVHVPGGHTAPKQLSPTAIKESGRARDSLARTILGGAVLILLCAIYTLALWQKPEVAQAALPLTGSGLGFLSGQGPLQIRR